MKIRAAAVMTLVALAGALAAPAFAAPAVTASPCCRQVITSYPLDLPK